MRSGRLVVAIALLTACGGAERHEESAAPPAPPAPPARTAPLLEIEPHASTKLEGCAVEIEPRPAEAGEKVLAEFRARNGLDWMGRTRPVDEFTGLVGVLSRTVPERVAEVTLDDATAGALAMALIHENRELFGLDADDVAAAKAPQVNKGQVTIRGERPRPGYESLDRLVRHWMITVAFGKDGKPAKVIAKNGSQPDVELCTDAAITPDEAKRAVIGHVPTFSNFGKQEKGTPVTESSIASIELDVHVDREKTGKRATRILRLAYRIDLSDGMWSYFVDAQTGALLAVVQKFMT